MSGFQDLVDRDRTETVDEHIRRRALAYLLLRGDRDVAVILGLLPDPLARRHPPRRSSERWMQK